ncbi:amino acid transporter [Cupriavidus sp. USMAA2-4]|uniref:Amino acid transporter n=1 Tax=Cupriavidus malaysiensis TaxID=367825 RepID=A0ABM6FBV6_9BURK|nr:MULTISPECIES: LysE family translocator [Cupriavidus]AOY96100.1 amino acid transporter [Cupriavidus sp. USMAA2-4]AOZ03467.1 amino acid transporter [Cupriavidus sp. USMAHM13]AOZ09171.1 amino acid transporter [Cupriavidus malaysiensis]
MTLSTLLLFVLASALAIVTPGPTVLLALNNGSRYGVRAACWGMAGAVAADVMLVTITAAGLGVLLAASEFAFRALKWAGAAYLAYVGWKLLRAPAPEAGALAPQPGLAEARDGARAHALFLRSFLVAATNPKALLFMSAFLPQFIDTRAALLPQYALIMGLLALLNVLAMLGYAMLGAHMMRRLRASGMRWLNRISGAALIGLAASLALFRRAQA